MAVPNTLSLLFSSRITSAYLQLKAALANCALAAFLDILSHNYCLSLLLYSSIKSAHENHS